MIKIFQENKSLTKQTLMLFISQVLNMIFGIALDYLNTKLLGKVNYGLYSFVTAFVLQVLLFFDFGIYFSGSRLIAISRNHSDEKNITGLLLLITAGIGILFSLIIFISSFFVDQIFNTSVGLSLRLLSLFVFIFPFQGLIPMICRGSNLIFNLALFNVLPKIIYIILIFLFINELNYTLSFVFLSIATLVATIIIIFQMKPGFKDISENIKILKKELHEYGLKIYYGNIINNLSQYFDKLLIPLIINTTALGVYSLSSRITNQIRIIPNSLSTSAFKKLAGSKNIPGSILKINLVLLVVSCAGLLILSPFIINLLFAEYTESLKIIPILIVAMFFGGLTSPYNSFLHVKKKGEYIRNIAIISPLINILLNCGFIPLFGIYGAAWALVISLFASYILYIYYYKKSLKEIETL